MNYEKIIGVPCSAPRFSLVCGWVAIVFFSGLLISLAAIIARDSASSSIEYVLLLLPLWAVATSVQRLRSDLESGQIIVREQGVEITKGDNKVLISWDAVKQVRVKRFYDAGLLLLTEKGERAFIPAGVTNYYTIRSFIAEKTSRRGGARQPATSS